MITCCSNGLRHLIPNEIQQTQQRALHKNYLNKITNLFLYSSLGTSMIIDQISIANNKINLF